MTADEAPWADEVRGLVARIGGDATRVRVLEAADSTDWAEASARDGLLTIRATDPVAAASGLARYLRHHGRRLTWEEPRLEPPLRGVGGWPDAGPFVVETPFAVRYHLNLVTHAYTAAFWDWPRWERELDWMALHGVTHPYVLTAYEVVLGEALRRSGVENDAVARWVGGATHVPWTAAGGMHSFGGPLPARWGSRRVILARRILARARALGMTPVLPVTGGHVPPARAGDEAEHIEWQGWRTPALSPSSAAYRRFVTTFLEVQRDLLGDLGPRPFLAVDPYLESLPPVDDEAALAASGRGTWEAMSAVHPGATWVLQGWPFHYHRQFWTTDRVTAYLGDVPTESLLLVDLWGEHAPMWRDGMHGRRWIWTAIHNFGGRFALFGDLTGLARDVAELRRKHPDRCEGVGLAPEAIENNTVFYELATDLTWSNVDVATWVDDFAVERYRPRGEEAGDGVRQAWRLLADTLYAPGRTRSIPSPVYARPWSATAPFATQRLAGESLPAQQRMSANVDAENDPAVLAGLPAVRQAARLLVSVADDVGARATLEHDVVELVGHMLAQGARVHIRGVLAAYADGDAAAVRRHGAALAVDLVDLDALCATRPESRVSTWIAQARAWAGTPAEAAVMERDARSLVSVWGHQTSGLHDYSGRHWSGLVRGLYLPRWQVWTAWLADAVEHASTPDVEVLRRQVEDVEESWRAATGSDDVGTDDPVAVAGRLLSDRVG
jgi:alpha-N-acetylglucosaminidase